MSPKTKSEELFEEACKSFGIACERVPTSTDETPDYKIKIGSALVIVEVKQFDLNDIENKALNDLQTERCTAFFPNCANRIREKIRVANSQLKALTQAKRPGMLVLCVGDSISGFDAEDMHDAMYGSETYNYAVPHRGPGD